MARANAVVISREKIAGATQWFQVVKSRHKLSSFDVISRVFSSKFQQIYNYFCFLGMSFILKPCQIVAGASMIHQFQEFFWFIFGGVFEIWSSVSPSFLFCGTLLRRCPATTTYYAFAEERNVWQWAKGPWLAVCFHCYSICNMYQYVYLVFRFWKFKLRSVRPTFTKAKSK